MQLFEKEGYRCTRSGASLGEFDFIGIRKEDIILVQVKTRDWPGTKEMQAIQDFPAPEICHKIVQRWKPRQRQPDQKVYRLGSWW